MNIENYICSIKIQLTIKKQINKHLLGQVIKGVRRMPWHQEPMKDGISTDMLRGVANRH